MEVPKVRDQISSSSTSRYSWVCWAPQASSIHFKREQLGGEKRSSPVHLQNCSAWLHFQILCCPPSFQLLDPKWKSPFLTSQHHVFHRNQTTTLLLLRKFYRKEDKTNKKQLYQQQSQSLLPDYFLITKSTFKYTNNHRNKTTLADTVHGYHIFKHSEWHQSH